MWSASERRTGSACYSNDTSACKHEPAFKNSTEHGVASYPSYLCCLQGMGSPCEFLCLALGSMNILTVQRNIVVSLSSDKCTFYKSLWIKVTDKCLQCKCSLNKTKNLEIHMTWATWRSKHVDRFLAGGLEG